MTKKNLNKMLNNHLVKENFTILTITSLREVSVIQKIFILQNMNRQHLRTNKI